MPVTIGAPREHGFDEPLGVLSDCHRRVERFLGVIVQVSLRGRATLDEGERAALTRALDYFRDAAPKHTADEEESLFPRLRAKAGAELREALERVERLEADHRSAAPLHAEVEELGRRWAGTGVLEAEELQRMADLGARLEALYREHIAVEDGELFPLAAQVLTQFEQSEIGAEMAARRGIGE